MSSTKIVVVQLKELIKSAVFVILGVILIGLLIYLFVPKDTAESSRAIYKPGTYSSAITLQEKAVDVQVTVDENAITAVNMQDLQEDQEVFYPLVKPTMENLSKEIVESQSLEVAISNDAAVTSRLLLKAIDEALAQARVDMEVTVE